MKKLTLAILLAGVLLSPVLLAAGDVIRAFRIEKAPKIDGRLDDEIWQSIEPFTDFKQVEPAPGAPPSEKTELRVAYDQDHLYIGLYCFDREPRKISANNMAHDSERERRARDDLIRILIDSLQDKRNAYVFFINPRGARSEGLAAGENFSLNWDGIWEAKSAILDDGWSCEIIIPFKEKIFS